MNSELDERVWGVISHIDSHVNLTYDEATNVVKLLAETENEFQHTAAVVTSEAAKRAKVRTNEIQSNESNK